MVRDGPFRPPPAGHSPTFNAFIALGRPACRPGAQARARSRRPPWAGPASVAAMPARQCSRFRSRKFRNQGAKTVVIRIARMSDLRLPPTRVPGWQGDDADGRCHLTRHAKNRVSERRALQHQTDGRLTAALRVPTTRSRAAIRARPELRRLPAAATRQGLASGPIRRRAERLGRFRCKTARGNCSHTLVLIGNVNCGIRLKGTPGRK